MRVGGRECVAARLARLEERDDLRQERRPRLDRVDFGSALLPARRGQPPETLDGDGGHDRRRHEAKQT